MPGDLVFTSGKVRITSQNLQVEAGDEMTFTGGFGNNNDRTSLTIKSDSRNPGYPEKWILRQTGSMQNIVFPGMERINLNKPITLRYSIIIRQEEQQP
jgi:hypothetical protein